MAEVQTHTEAGEMTQIFIEFVMMQAQNAALFLGQVPNPRGQEVEVNLPLAKMFIDQLAVIREKTKGNLNPDEQKVIDSAISQLQMAFVEVAQVLRAENLGAEIPEPLGMHSTAQGAPPAAAAPEAAPKIVPPDAPTPEPPAEEGRKRFSKSYGS
ncbi:MAG: hypothetical protein QOE70_181 [Chthoniobacter sp.]|jgi:hypothetical protein|nr:hypothetical protein [Chthoniobacter sp.]